MVGEPLQQVEEGIATIIKELKTDPYALETAYISIIGFAGKPITIVPFQDLITFYPPRLFVGPGTDLGSGLGHLMYELRRNVKATTMEAKGDWKPIVFLFTDGAPTDDPSAAIAEWKSNWARKANMVAVSFGNEADLSVLNQISDNVLVFNNSSASSYSRFFKWISGSIKSTSLSIEQGGSDFELSKIDSDILSKADTSPQHKLKVDQNYAIFSARCQRSKKPYLIKYGRDTKSSDLPGLEMNTSYYRLVGGYAVDERYFELASEHSPSATVNSEELAGFPACPVCGNQFGFALCKCGKVHCVGDEKQSTCPWCNSTAEYGFGSGSANIGRSHG